MRKFSEELSGLGKGSVDDELTAALKQVVAAVNQTGKKGWLKL